MMTKKDQETKEATAGCFLICALFLFCAAAGLYWGLITGLLCFAAVFLIIGLSVGFS